MIILRPPERGQDLTINHPSQPIKLIGTAGARSAPAFFRRTAFRGPAGISFLYSKNFSAGRRVPSPPRCFVFPFPSLIFLFKEPIKLLSRNEKYINTQRKIRQYRIFYFFKIYHKDFVIFYLFFSLIFSSQLPPAEKLNHSLD